MNIENISGSNFDDIITGSVLNNVLIGQGGNDVINGGAGNDSVIGASGADTLIGGSGADFLNGGEGVDTADYFSSNASVTINLSTGMASGGHAAGDTLAEVENIYGSDGFGDTLIGDAASNVLMGLGGDDTIFGEAGDCLLYTSPSPRDRQKSRMPSSA